MKNIEFSLLSELWSFDIVIFYDCSTKFIKESCKRNKIKDSWLKKQLIEASKTTPLGGAITISKNTRSYIYVTSITDIELITLLVHEMYHAVNYLLKYKGIKYCYKTEEAYAYTLDCFVGMALKEFKKYKLI